MAPRFSGNHLVITAAVLAAVCLAVPFLANQLKSKGARVQPGGQERRPLRSEPTKDFFSFVVSLPSYQSLERSLEDLATASANCLNSAAEENPTLLLQGAEDYRQALRVVKEHFSSLVKRIGRERAETVFEELWISRQADFVWNPTEFVFSTRTP